MLDEQGGTPTRRAERRAPPHAAAMTANPAITANCPRRRLLDFIIEKTGNYVSLAGKIKDGGGNDGEEPKNTDQSTSGVRRRSPLSRRCERSENAMSRLAPEHLPAIAARGVATPLYRREVLKPGLGHLGVGAFHRCHQADFTEDLLNQGLEDRLILGMTIRPPAVAATIGAQSGLYSQSLVDGEARTVRVIGALGGVIDGVENTRPVAQALIDPALTVVTMTITEKGYCHVPATGALNEDHPDVVADLEERLLEDDRQPRTAPGLLVRALDMRRRVGAPGLTLISCDNVPSNGAVLRGVVSDLARAHDPALAEWILAHVAFPSTMVDRIAPATTKADERAAEAALGVADLAPVVGEPFRQWVIEHVSATDLPRWDEVGAEFAPNVEPYELLKMRILNGAQSALCCVGAFLGLATTCDDVQDPALQRFVRRMLMEESAPTLPSIPGVDVDAYVAASLGRLANRAIRHSNHQIATDGSQKIVQRLLRPAQERLAAGASAGRLTIAAAAWAAYVAAASPRYGARWRAQDPMAGMIAQLAAEADDAEQLARAVLGIDAIFPPALAAQPTFRADFARAFEKWLREPSRAVLDPAALRAAGSRRR